MVTEAIGRRIRLAVIGGGLGSVIGEIHRIAARLDGDYEIVASVLSSDPERRGGRVWRRIARIPQRRTSSKTKRRGQTVSTSSPS